MSFHAELTYREREILDLLVEQAKERPGARKPDYEEIAKKIGIKKSSVSTALWRLRERYKRALGFVKEYRRYQRKLARWRIL